MLKTNVKRKSMVALAILLALTITPPRSVC